MLFSKVKIIYLCNLCIFVRQEQLLHNAYGISERDNISSRDPQRKSWLQFFKVPVSINSMRTQTTIWLFKTLICSIFSIRFKEFQYNGKINAYFICKNIEN